jgi:hypothetical protein
MAPLSARPAMSGPFSAGSRLIHLAGHRGVAAVHYLGINKSTLEFAALSTRPTWEAP